jgi:hypothetical protein
MAVGMPVMALEDALVTMLYALDEHALDYSRLLAITRALREQIDWTALRSRASASPFANAFFTLVEELGIAPTPSRSRAQRSNGGAGEAHSRVRVIGGTE